MLGKFFGRTIQAKLPPNFNETTMYGFIEHVIDEKGDARGSQVEIDFSELNEISTVGVVVLSNVIEYLRKCKCEGILKQVKQTPAVSYLDDAKFFERYNKKPLRADAALRPNSFPLTLVSDQEAMGFLYSRFIPWVSLQLGVSVQSLASIRVCIEEILHNVNDHSGVGVGCVHAQLIPEQDELHIAISDFGVGIPANVQKLRPALKDADAIRLACEVGFTTQSNVRNRGAGLPNLLQIVPGKARGVVRIVSGYGNISAVEGAHTFRVTARTRSYSYPGTLVHVVLRVNAVTDLAKDVQPEEFSWD